ncbi:hypothetical protein OAK98_05785, partial [Mariniblastus sp.]|nr:hypothetical protein [Mariniblastus sp.]
MRLSLHSYWGVMLVIAISGGTLFAHDDNDGKGINGSAGANYGFGTNSFTDGYDSKNINLLSHLYLNEIGSLGASNVIGNDIWGWTDVSSGREFALMGLTNRTSFIEVTNP